MTELHLTDEQLASLADDSLPESDRGLLIEHLRACDVCHAAFREAVRYRAILLADATVFRAPDDVLRLARQIAAPRRQPAARPRWFASPVAVASLTAATMVVAAVGLWNAGIQPGGNDYDRYFGPLQAAAASASAEGSIVLPGAENAAAESPQFRSGMVEPNAAIESALDQLERAYGDDPTPEVAHWLVTGYLATGDVDQAGMYVRDARVRFPDEARFLVMDAIVAYRSDDMDRAERLLQAAIETDPDNGAALLNLALVQYELGHEASARRTLEIVRTRFPGSPLEARASMLISDLVRG